MHVGLYIDIDNQRRAQLREEERAYSSNVTGYADTGPVEGMKK